MKISSIILVAQSFTSVAAFAPTTVNVRPSTMARSAFLNGWTPDESKFCYGLPGKVAPFGEGFDPFGISERESMETIKTFRESEVTHGRVAMLAGTWTRLIEKFPCPLFVFAFQSSDSS